jgi:hypothetical protein
MQVKQISIFMENRAGRLNEITGVLAGAKINIRALSLADTSDFGILRLIVDRPDAAIKVLHENRFTLKENQVIACVIEDKPGGLHLIIDMLAAAGISIEYMYSFFGKQPDNAIVVLRVEDMKKSIEILLKNGVTLLSGEQLYSI